MPSDKKPIDPASRKRSTPRKADGAAASEPVWSDSPATTEPIPGVEPISVERPSKLDQTFTFKATHFYAVLVVLAFAAGVLIGYAAWGRQTPTVIVPDQSQVQAPAAAAPTSAPQYVRYKIPTDGFPSLGPANAPITVVEFADFQCPFCRQWEQQTYKPLLDAYPGKIRIVYRDFPLTSIHPNAMPAAEAAQCANEQGQFWPFHDKLFSSETLSTDVYNQYAQQLGLDMTKFDSCLTSHKYASQIQADSDFATNLGINSTPTFFINGLAIIGAQPLEEFKSVIDKELAGQIPK